MSKITFQQIKRDVRIILDENEDNTSLLEELEPMTLETEKMLRENVLQSIDEVLLSAQLYLLKDAVVTTSINLKKHKPYGKMGEVPQDFLRFVSAFTTDWYQRVYDPIDQDSDEYQMQRSPFAGIRGNVDRPQIAIIPEGTKLTVEVYDTLDETLTFDYIPKSQGMDAHDDIVNEANDDKTYPIPDLCYKAVCYTIAKYYLISIGENDKAAAMSAIAAGLIGVEQTST